MIDFNTEPYYDDFSEENKFYRILFRPSVAVQARELNQIQSIIQNQIKQHGDHIFKHGTVVNGGNFSIAPSKDYVKLSGIGSVGDVSNLIGLTVTNANNLSALVVHAVAATSTDPATLYLSYKNSATDTTTKVFSNSDSLTVSNNTYTNLTVASSNSTGFGSIATVDKGIFYINGFFVLNDAQTIVLDKYGITPTYRIGFVVNQSILTEDDAGYDSLLDNAQGSPNYAAPGAHRYFIDLILTALSTTDSDTNFIELGRVNAGIIVNSIENTGYSELEKTFARRTYDESGNYTVSPFAIDVREHRDNNRGAWNVSKSYIAGDVVTSGGNSYYALMPVTGGTAPTGTTISGSWQYTPTPFYNRGIYKPDAASGEVGDESKLAIGFEPGTAYVQGFEIETRSTRFVTIPKARDTAFDNNSSVSVSVGSYVQLKDLHNLPSIAEGSSGSSVTVNLYDGIVSTPGTASGSQVGICRINGVQYESGSGSTMYCRVFLSNIVMNSGKDFGRNVKSFYYASTSFTANVTPDTYSQQIGTISTNSGSTTVTGTGTRWLTGTSDQVLATGDYIYYNDGSQRTAKVLSVGSDTSITLTANAPSTATNVAGLRVQTAVIEPSNSSLVFNLPRYAINLAADHNYYVIQRATIQTVVGNVLNISIGSGTLLSDLSNYYIQDASGNSISASSVTASSNTAAITFGSAPSTSYVVLCTVNKSGIGGRKTKTLNTVTAESHSAASSVTLNNSDCYRLLKVTAATSGDVTTWYDFNDGQKDTIYDYGSITLKAGYPVPTGTLTIDYQYYSHGTGDFFDLNSYGSFDVSNVWQSPSAKTDYKLIPFYNGICLRDCVDFRSKIDSYSLSLPKRGYNMSIDLTYYLARTDKIALDTLGNFFDIKGSSSLVPAAPDEPSIGMTLCSIELSPYVYTNKDLKVSKVENKRYTMRDIGKLEKRIDTLEYYTSLSLLEQQTTAMNITDANGLDRFKNGFIVDSFNGHNIGNTTSPDYLCAIDMVNNELRPFSSMDNINLILDTAVGAGHSNNYKLYGDVITLPLDSTAPHVRLAENVYASRTEFVNPFAVFTFIGDVQLNPSSDDWFEVNRAPDIVQNVEGNYNAIATLAEKSGTLGTVWNAWQTEWTGTSFVTGTEKVGGYIQLGQSTFANLNAQFGNAAVQDTIAQQIASGKNPTVGARYVTLQTSATLVGQSRTGVKTSVVAKFDNKTIDDKVISTAVIPYIRSRNILVQAKGLKPNTRFYPFFDNIDVSAYCTPAKVLTYTTGNGLKFDSTTSSGINSISAARSISGDTQVCLNIGDVITGSSSGATAVVVGSDTIGATKVLYVDNVIGTFTTSDTITGSISGATGTFVSITTPSTFVSSVSGDLNMRFNIPNSSDIKFRTGSREFKLIDRSTATDNTFTSRGIKNYVASGTIQTKQATIVSTRNAEIVQEAVNANQIITQSSTRVVQDTGWYDPLAQSFLIDCKGGAMLSKVDLFFASKDPAIPVTIEIREMVNGYPGKNVLPFSRVTVKPENINLSSNYVTTYDGTQYPSYDTATTINFPSPVYVNDKTEYALVVLSDSNLYKVWISQLGDRIPGSTSTISEQPYAGVLFKSQNASTWTADQMQDLKFTVWRANFDTSVQGNIVLTNDLINTQTLDTNPIQTITGSADVRVWHRNHGFKTGDYVIISGATSTDSNITATKLNTYYQVQYPTLDSYTLTITGSGTNTAAATAYIGGSSIVINRSIKYDTLYPNISALTIPGTSVNYTLKTTDWATATKSSVAYPCNVNDNNYFVSPQVLNTGSTTSDAVGAVNKLDIIATFSTTNSSISPLIDTHGTSAILVSNKVDNLQASNFGLSAWQTALYKDDTTPVGSSNYSNYVSKIITLQNYSNLIRVRLAANVPTQSDIAVYYKTGTNGTDFNSTAWTLLSPDNTIPKTGLGSNSFYDIDYTKDNLPLFNNITIKIVMKSTNTAAVPRIKDLRIIACAQ